VIACAGAGEVKEVVSARLSASLGRAPGNRRGAPTLAPARVRERSFDSPLARAASTQPSPSMLALKSLKEGTRIGRFWPARSSESERASELSMVAAFGGRVGVCDGSRGVCCVLAA
jgi:hypothetical protein